MNILFDTNIILDVLLNRQPFAIYSIPLMSAVETKQLTGYLCATTVTTLDYLITKSLNKNTAKKILKQLLTLFKIAEVNDSILKLALQSHFLDFEDAVLNYSATNHPIDGLVTRKPKDFKTSQLTIYSPQELVSFLALQKN